jgi:hypothetical protein
MRRSARDQSASNVTELLAAEKALVEVGCVKRNEEPGRRGRTARLSLRSRFA